MRYQVNAPQVIAETVAEETMIVDLSSGHYFNLQGAGADVWEYIERETSLPVIVAQLEGRYVADEGEIEAAVIRLIGELEGENLIVPANGDGLGVQEVVLSGVGDRVPFPAPVLSKFTDMQDIILLDPVHEVDARGWPHAAPASS
jgi:hypothetical protein